MFFADEIVRKITVGMLARYPTRKMLSGAVFVASMTTMPHKVEIQEIPAKMMAAMSRAAGALVSIMPRDEFMSSNSMPSLLRVCASENAGR